jgi:hypothetical protein
MRERERHPTERVRERRRGIEKGREKRGVVNAVLPDIERSQHHRRRLAHRFRQPRRTLGPESPSVAERHPARPLGPHPAHQPHGPARRHLPHPNLSTGEKGEKGGAPARQSRAADGATRRTSKLTGQARGGLVKGPAFLRRGAGGPLAPATPRRLGPAPCSPRPRTAHLTPHAAPPPRAPGCPGVQDPCP